MSLADLYRTNDGDSDSEGSSDDGEFVLEEEEAEEEEEEEREEGDSDIKDDDGSGKSPVGDEQRKRRIDDIWSEMNATASDNKRAGKVPRRVEEATPEPEQESSTSGDVEDQENEKKVDILPPAAAAATSHVPRVRKRPVSKFSKVAEMVEQRRAKRENTLDTARRQWTGFVDSQGIRDDLERANKDGYVERQQFLNRVDERTYRNTRANQKR
ncbi:hypothetical protein EV175_000784 [Coemansia sp. RSA 1933]|nr:hypothetical protein EV175_000784 [Coemansia sp. RSA 1933]